MWRFVIRGLCFSLLPALPVLSNAKEISDFSANPDLPSEVVASGFEFLTPESQALQLDDFANPGFLWVDRGRLLFEKQEGKRACVDCHSERDSEMDSEMDSRREGKTDPESDGKVLPGSATRFPKINQDTNQLINLEGQINHCRVERQSLSPLPYESEQLLSLTAYVTSLSRNMAYDIAIDGTADAYYDRGRAYFFKRKGQLNLACSQCHDDNWGKLLRGDRISQGHPNAYPGYRLEWQNFGSLHRRFRDCDVGVKAEPFAAGSETYLALELYLKWRAKRLLIESPGIRR